MYVYANRIQGKGQQGIANVKLLNSVEYTNERFCAYGGGTTDSGIVLVRERSGEVESVRARQRVCEVSQMYTRACMAVALEFVVVCRKG